MLLESVLQQENSTKVPIEGRRRLCKVSSQVDNAPSEKEPALDDPKFSDLTDFDASPGILTLPFSYHDACIYIFIYVYVTENCENVCFIIIFFLPVVF